MSTFHKQILAGCAAIGLSAAALSGAAIAQTPPAQGSMSASAGQRSEQWQQKRAEHRQKRMAAMHDSLKLTAAQEPAWKTFVEKSKPAEKMNRPNREEMAKLSAPERADRHMAMMKEHETHMATRIGALKDFYAVLTPEQKKTMDTQPMKHHGRGMHGGGGHHGGDASK